MLMMRSRYNVVWWHIGIWGILLGIPTALLKGTFLGLSHAYFFIASLFHIGIFYFNAYFLYPKLLTRKTWWLYIILLVAVFFLSYYLKLFFLQLDKFFRLTKENSDVIFFGVFPFIVASIIFRLISDRIRFERMEKEARAEHLSAELKYLRSQVSPHFLFNMMTNMVALARQKSDLLEPSLIQLSELLRYMLYDSADHKISTAKEIEHLKNYIALQQLRFGDDVELKVNISNQCPGCIIEPMLLVPFIENSFKHGIGMADRPYIHIELQINEQQLDFKIANKYNKQAGSKDSNSGIGLDNVKHRLQLLYYGKYKLNISRANNVYAVHLNLFLW